MQTQKNSYLLALKNNNISVKTFLRNLSLLILASQLIIFISHWTGGNLLDAQILAWSMAPIALALILSHMGYIEIAGAIIAFSLSISITVLATEGQGIYDIAIIAFPCVLIISSLVLRRSTVVTLTFLILACMGWLVFGAAGGMYLPNHVVENNFRQFITPALILIVTMLVVNTLSKTVQDSITSAQKELAERRRVESALRQAETLYRSLVENTSVVVYRDFPTESADVAYISPQIEGLTGYTQQEWTVDPTFWQKIVHPDDLQRVLGLVKDYIKTGDRSMCEYRIHTRDGRWIWVRDESVVITDDSGSPQYVQGVIIDTTEEKNALAAVKQRETILSAVADTARSLLQSTDWQLEMDSILQKLGAAANASHAYIFKRHKDSEGNDLLSQIFEWAHSEVNSEIDNPVYRNMPFAPMPGMEIWYENLRAGRPYYSSVHSVTGSWKKVFEDRGLKTILDMPILSGKVLWGVIGFDHKELEFPWSQTEIDALAAAAGNIGTAIERQRIDQDLRTSEEKFQLAFHHSPVAMAISRTSDHALIDVNDAFCRQTGYLRKEVIGRRAGRDLKIWVAQHDRNSVLETLQNYGFVDEYKAEFKRKNGDIGVGMLSAVNVNINGEVCQLFSFYDVSRIEQLVSELRVRNNELQSFTYTVSHDLKAPLVTITGFMGYLKQDAASGNIERLNKDIQRINDAIQKMQRLLNELLELSRIGRIMNPPEEVPFEEIAREALELAQGRLDENRVRVEIQPGLPNVHVDRARIVEVLQNLVDNSAKFMGDQKAPLIEIGSTNLDGKRVFHVRDNGIGIEEDYREKIFGLFNKLDANSEGTGIGLSLVKRIVEVHGGRIWVESDGRGKGSTFYFYLSNRPTPVE